MRLKIRIDIFGGKLIKSARVVNSFCFFLAVIFVQSTVQAQLSLQDAVIKAQKNSPDIRSLENQFESLDAKKRQAFAPYEPSLTLSYNDLTKEFNHRSATSRVLQVNQQLGFPGRAYLNYSLLDDQAQVFYIQSKAMTLQVALNVKQAYYALALAQKNIQLNQEQRASYERILAIAKRRYEAGALTQVDYLNTQVALLSADNDLSDFQSAEKVARTQLNVLLGNPVEAQLQVEPVKMYYYSEISKEEAIQKMLDHRAEISAAKKQVSASERSYKLAWMSLLPDFQLFAGTTYYDVPGASPLSGTTGEDHTFLIGVQVTVPIWAIFNERQAIVGASHDRAAAQANLDVVFNQSKIALETALENLTSLRHKIENYEKHLIPLVDQSFNLALTNYSTGKTDFQTLSDTANTRRNLKRDYASAVMNYLTNYSTYSQLVGEDY